MKCRWSLILAAFPFFTPAASADVVTLKSGARLEGIARKEGDKVVLENFVGTTVIPLADVAAIDDKHTSKLEEYQQREVSLRDSKDPRSHLELAIWLHEQRAGRFLRPHLQRALELGRALAQAQEVAALCTRAADAGLASELRPLWGRVLELDPDHEPARRALGFRRHQGAWLLEDEFHAAIGQVKFEGRWMDPAERDLLVKARALRLEERAREMEARERKLQAAEKALADERDAVAKAAARVEEARRDVERERRMLQEREDDLRARERRLAGLVTCGACDGFFRRGSHLCSRVWIACRTCDGFFRSGHKCPKK